MGDIFGIASGRMAGRDAAQEPADAWRASPDYGNARLAEDGWDDLMAAALTGNSVAYRHLLGELRWWLHRFYTLGLPPVFVDGAVQDTLIAIREKRHTYDPRRPFKPWLMAVARYKWADRLREIERSIT